MDTHFVLGSKGGIGKSLASAFLASFFQSKGADVHCFDTDPQNHTLGGYTAFPVKILSLRNALCPCSSRFPVLKMWPEAAI